MSIPGISYNSDIQLIKRDGGVVEERDHYWVVRFPRNEEWIWANFLLLKDPPKADEFLKILEISKHELGNTWFMAVGWLGVITDPSDIDPFLEFGFEFEQNDVLLCTQETKPAKYLNVEIIPCESDDDWERVLENHKFLFARGKYKEDQIDFFTKRFQYFRRISESGQGNFFEGKIGDDVVGSFGLFYYDNEARFQEVTTYPRFRNMGVAQSICFEGIRWAKKNWNSDRIVTVANLPEALNCYRNLGFSSVEIQEGLKWVDPRKYPKI